MQGGDGLRRGMVADAQMHARMARTELPQHRQQQTAQRALARGEKHAPVLERPVLRDGGLPCLDLSKGHADVPVERLALRRQDQAAVRPGEERAAQLRFQRFDRTGEIRLAVLQQRRRLRQIAALRGVVKDPVIFVVDIHGFPLLTF